MNKTKHRLYTQQKANKSAEMFRERREYKYTERVGWDREGQRQNRIIHRKKKKSRDTLNFGF